MTGKAYRRIGMAVLGVVVLSGFVLGVLGLRPAVQEEREGEVQAEIPLDVASHIDAKRGMIVVENPQPLSVVTSPVSVRGEARGGWYFEGDFPVVLVDWDGRIIAQSFATARGEWMTEEFVPFEGEVSFENPSWETEFSKRGTLILQKDNPSGLPERDDALEIPVLFE